jgi:hypothetical protein
MRTELPDWPRQYFTKASGTPLLFYVAFGKLPEPLSVSASAYRFGGVPSGVEILQYGPDNEHGVAASFRDGYLWNRLQIEYPALAAIVEQQEHCIVLRGELADSRNLNEFRDIVGLLTCLLDSGCVAILDPQMFKWWSPGEWRADVFDCGGPAPRAHVTVICSEDEGSTEWIHTRGMRKFGRPDLSIRRVADEYREGVIDLCNRFIEFQAFGGVIADGQEVRMRFLPAGMRCFNRGSYDDPDFNNLHIEIEWPEGC